MILHVRAIEARDLPKMDVIGKVDAYLKFKLSSDLEHKQKTHVIKKNYNPVWNEEFHFKVDPSKNEVLHAELYDWDKVSANDLISTHDFEISSFQPGRVIEIWETFFPAPKVHKPGRVHLVFHLANEGDEPFVEKFVADRGATTDLLISPLTEDEMQEARQKFTIIDTNRNGVLEESELDSYFRQEKRELQCFSKLICEIYGTDGQVSVDQFFQFYKSLAADRNSDEFIGRHIFDYIDTDHSGTIEAKEFQKVVDLIKIPDGFKYETIDRVDVMNYEQFSDHFYTLLRMAWRGLIRPNSVPKF
ncbi:hypothetical protein M9Y10_026089 [Tritrichomonas musculus]|uniref:C2 domain containing protein n=1 Tax=Tritrichomonas musculus TaxID=1915356 RepID=A0ABR2H8F2_9EUKA